jgi:glycosyltransferase involved in cell wall biosynthesis
MSVAVPTFEYYGMGVEMLDSMFKSIKNQTLDSIQVVVSDHSRNNEIENYCNMNIYDLDIKYIRNDKERGNPGFNTNNAIDNCDGEVIKVMQQDDYFYKNNSLEKIYNLLNSSNESWLVCGAIHTNDNGNTYYRPMFPSWSDMMILYYNNNHIGGVSVVAIKNTVVKRFDANVRMTLDVDYYYNLKTTYGDPIYCNSLLIVNRVREYNTLSSEISQEEIEEEYKYCHAKYGISLP